MNTSPTGGPGSEPQATLQELIERWRQRSELEGSDQEAPRSRSSEELSSPSSHANDTPGPEDEESVPPLPPSEELRRLQDLLSQIPAQLSPPFRRLQDLLSQPPAQPSQPVSVDPENLNMEEDKTVWFTLRNTQRWAETEFRKGCGSSSPKCFRSGTTVHTRSTYASASRGCRAASLASSSSTIRVHGCAKSTTE